MFDFHTLVDIGSIVITVIGAHLATIRVLGNRLRKVEIKLAKIEGALENSGYKL